MSNDLNGTSGSYRTSPPPNEATTHLTENKTASSSLVDFRPYDSMETMSNGAVAFIPQQFSNKQLYDADAQNPSLIQPDADGETGPQPYGAAEQKLIMRFFYNRLKELLTKSPLSPEETQVVYQALASNTPLTNPKLAQLAKNLAKQAKADTREQARLPESWDPHSASAQDWEPSLPPPYKDADQAAINQSYDQSAEEALEQFIAQASPPLSASHIEQLKQALATGKVSSNIAEDFMAITKKATESTQQAYGLSEAWFKATSNLEDWRPIHLGIVTPTAVNQARGELILENIAQLLVDYQKAGEKVANQFDNVQSQEITMDEFSRAISKAIQKLKKTLRDIQLKDADSSDTALDRKMDAIEVQKKKFQEQIEKQKEAEEKKRKAEKVGLAMKFAGPAIAALSTIVGAALLIFTGGASAALIVAGIAIGVAMTTYSIVDSKTGCTAKLMQTINEALEKAHPGNEELQKILKATILAAVVIVLIIAIVVTAGGAAGSIASNAAIQTVKEIVKQLAIQMLMISVMASNAIPELVNELLKRAPIDDKTRQILETVTVVIVMVIMMIAAVKLGGQGASKGAQGAEAAAKEAAVVNQEVRTAMQRVQDMTKSFATKLANVPGKVGDAAKETLEGIKEFGRGFKLAGSLIKIASTKLDGNNISQALKDNTIQNLAKTGYATQKLLQVTPMAINIADGINRGVLGLQVVRLLEEVGDHKDAVELLQGIIQLLEKLLNGIQTGVDANSEFILNLQRAFNSFYAGLSQNTNKIFQSLQA